MATAIGDAAGFAPKPVDGGHRQMWQRINSAIAEADAGLASANVPPLAQVPLVDISCFVHVSRATQADRDTVVDQVLAAAQHPGFMNVVGHGVPQHIIDSALIALETFFRSPVEQKQRCVSKSFHGTERGYVPYKSENVKVSLGRAGPACLRECFSFGPPEHLGGSAYGENSYPDFVDGFSHHVDSYYSEVQRVEKVMLEILSLALSKATGRSLDPQYLFNQIGLNRGLMKAAWSWPCQPSPEEARCDGHTDWGPLTILLTTSPGLEVCTMSEESKVYQWHPVPVVPGAFTVNIGDQLARWSNDLFTSTIHRVNANVNCDSVRISLPYFSTQVLPLHPTSDPKVECICRDGEEPKYEPLSIGDYLRRNFSLLHTPCAEAGGA